MALAITTKNLVWHISVQAPEPQEQALGINLPTFYKASTFSRHLNSYKKKKKTSRSKYPRQPKMLKVTLKSIWQPGKDHCFPDQRVALKEEIS